MAAAQENAMWYP